MHADSEVTERKKLEASEKRIAASRNNMHVGTKRHVSTKGAEQEEEEEVEEEEEEAGGKSDDDVTYPAYHNGQKVDLLEGNLEAWGRTTILDAEPKRGKAKGSDFESAHWPLVDSSKLQIITDWEDEELFP
jgi:hypothetical protein